MGDTEFLAQAEAALDAIEQALDELNDKDVVDVECSRSGNVLEIEFLHNGSKIIVNSQSAMKELWVAARAGGYHYRQDAEGRWLNTRDGSELYASLSELASAQSGAPVIISAP
jgi:CyaY protein